jgi:hypothetical protein
VNCRKDKNRNVGVSHVEGTNFFTSYSQEEIVAALVAVRESWMTIAEIKKNT